MGLRFTDTNKWRDPWFMDLSVTLKCLWNYVCDNCDNAGVWAVNIKLAEFEIGSPIDWRDAIERLSDRVRPLDNGKKWYLTKFVNFQNPGGLGDSGPHRQVQRLLASHGLSLPLSPLEKKGSGRLPEGSSEPPRQDQTRPAYISQGECRGGAVTSKPDLRLLLAEHALPCGKIDIAEWKGGLRVEAKCKSVDEARVFIRWAVGVCASQGVKVEHWRHVRLLAVEWDLRERIKNFGAVSEPV